MKKWNFLIHPVLIFVLAQLAWLSLLGLWIYWYVSNYIIFTTTDARLLPQIVDKGVNVTALVSGIILLVAILVGIYMIFIYLNKQARLTRLYDNFVANITHELKSPLASIQLYLETMHLRDVPRDKQKEFIGLMLKDANRLKLLINSILEISKLEQKQIAHNFQIYQADNTIRSLLQESIEQFKLSGNAIVITGRVFCHFVIDRDALRIVFNNLVDNAIKYSVDAVRISVRLIQDEKTISIEFADRGVGIAPKNQKKIFNKFHRIYGTNMPNVKGTGLGLYWVKEIIKYHGGRVTAFSEGKNKGSTFTIELPIYRTSKRRYLNALLRITRKNILSDNS